MANKKNYWYVIVMTESGAKFVTDKDYASKTAFWDGLEPPAEFGRYSAEDLAMGLMLNGYLAYAVMSPIEIDAQPYRYNKGHFEWVLNKESEQK